MLTPTPPTAPNRWVRRLAVVLIALGLSCPASAQTGQLEVTVSSIGVGGLSRQGDWIGVRIDFRDSATTRRELLFRMMFSDVDGDTAIVQRAVASNPDIRQSVWLYTRLPMGTEPSARLKIAIHEAVESTVTEAGTGRSAGKRLFTDERTINPAPPSRGLIARIGTKDLQLGTMSLPSWSLPFNPSTQERLLVAGISLDGLPDRWMGLTQYDAIVWTQGEPTSLSASQAGALRDYVNRGGHLVVVLPPVGQTWIGSSSTNLLSDLMPDVQITRLESTGLEPYRALVDQPEQPDPKATQAERDKINARANRPLAAGTVHILEPAKGAAPNEAIPFLAGLDGKPVVTRRLVGTGMVTLVGLDLAALAPNRLPDPEVFWNRVLGLRGHYDTKKATMGAASRTGYIADGFVSANIDKRGTAAAGVLLGFAVFSLYWIVAAPISYYLLKKRNLQHHAWIVFLLSSAAFTAIAWGSAMVIRPHRVSAQHVTVLEHIYGQPIERARAWFNVMVPRYGSATIGFDTSSASPVPFQVESVIVPWDGLDPSAGVGGKFPDARSYATDARTHNTVTFPARQTVKQFQADWVGGPRWGMPRPVSIDPESTADPVITLSKRSSRTARLGGTLRHDLPAPLKNVSIIVSWGQVGLPQNNPQRLLASAEAWKLVNTWAPGEDLDLATITASTTGSRSQSGTRDINPYIDNLVVQSSVTTIGTSFSSNAMEGVEASSFLSIFPESKTTSTFSSAVHMMRYALHGWDLGRWLMQPCVIIIGQLDDADADEPFNSPIPITIDDRTIATRGTTIVRWIYPLPASPPELDRLEIDERSTVEENP